jgi:primase-polymerase (primpol)-like protein
MIAVECLPPEVRTSGRAVVWRAEWRNGRWTKPPYQVRCPTRRAAVNRPATWGLFGEAVAVVAAGHADGAGIVLGAGLCGADLDECVDPVSGAIDPDAREIVRVLDSYTELSPSHAGLHILLRGSVPSGVRRAGVELYAEGRFFTVTGAHLAGTPWTIEARPAELAALHGRLCGTTRAPVRPVPRPPAPIDPDDGALLARAHAARNGAKFAALYAGDTAGYQSHSEADLALCNLLAFWTGGDAARMDTLFRSSGLMRAKWDEPHGIQTYGDLTIAKALGCVTNWRPS